MASAAQVGYEAFIEDHDSRIAHQFRQPTWDNCPEIIRLGWEAAAKAIQAMPTDPTLTPTSEAIPIAEVDVLKKDDSTEVFVPKNVSAEDQLATDGNPIVEKAEGQIWPDHSQTDMKPDPAPDAKVEEKPVEPSTPDPLVTPVDEHAKPVAPVVPAKGAATMPQ